MRFGHDARAIHLDRGREQHVVCESTYSCEQVRHGGSVAPHVLGVPNDMARHLAETAAMQAPIGSGFSPATTAAEVIEGIDLSGRTAVVTGGAVGIGLETTRALRSAGARVTVAVRDVARTREILAELDDVEIAQMDLMDPSSIDAFAAAFIASGEPLHLLVNNAGIGGTPLYRDGRGYESVFATNHLGHFQLTARLWPALVAAEGARVDRGVVLGPSGHRRGARRSLLRTA